MPRQEVGRRGRTAADQAGSTRESRLARVFDHAAPGPLRYRRIRVCSFVCSWLQAWRGVGSALLRRRRPSGRRSGGCPG